MKFSNGKLKRLMTVDFENRFQENHNEWQAEVGNRGKIVVDSHLFAAIPGS